MPMSLKLTFLAQTCLLNFKIICIYTTAYLRDPLKYQMGIFKLTCPKLNLSFSLPLQTDSTDSRFSFFI